VQRIQRKKVIRLKIGIDQLKGILERHPDTEITIERFGKIANGKCNWMIRFTLPSYGNAKIEIKSNNPKADEICKLTNK